MAIVGLILLGVCQGFADPAETKMLRTKQNAQVSQIEKIYLAVPHLEVHLEDAATTKMELEVTAVKAVAFEVSKKVLRLKASSLEQLPPMAKILVRIKGPSLPIEVQSFDLNLKSVKWKKNLTSSSSKAQIKLENTEGVQEIQSTELNLETFGSRGELTLSAKNGTQSFEKFQGMLSIKSGESEIAIRDSDLSLLARAYGGKIEVIESQGRIDAQIEKSHFDVIKFNGIGEFKAQQARFKLLSHHSGRLTFVDKKSRFEILKEGPSWIDLRTETGQLSVDPLKPSVVNHEIRAQGFITENKGGGFIKINTQSGRVILK